MANINATTVAKTVDVLTDIFRKPNVPVANNNVRTVAVATAAEIQKSPDVALVPIQNEWASKSVWTMIITFLLSMLTLFGIDLDPELKSQIIAGLSSLAMVLIFVFKKWFTNSVTPSSASKM